MFLLRCQWMRGFQQPATNPNLSTMTLRLWSSNSIPASCVPKRLRRKRTHTPGSEARGPSHRAAAHLAVRIRACGVGGRPGVVAVFCLRRSHSHRDLEPERLVRRCRRVRCGVSATQSLQRALGDFLSPLSTSTQVTGTVDFPVVLKQWSIVWWSRKTLIFHLQSGGAARNEVSAVPPSFISRVTAS